MIRRETVFAGLLCLLPLCAEGAPKQSKQERLHKRRMAAEKRARLKQVDFWIKSLAKPRVQDRFEAVWNLRALAPDSVDPLVRVLTSRQARPKALQGMVEALSDIRSKKARPALEAAVVDESLGAGTRLTAMIALARLLDPPARDFLRSLALGKLPKASKQEKRSKARSKKARSKRARRKGQPEVPPLLRRAALIALGMLSDAGLRPAIDEALKLERDPETRRAAYRAIGYLKDRRLVPTCVEGLKDTNLLVRGQAANALGKTGDVKTGDVLERTIAKMPATGERFLLVDALAWLGRQSALEELIRVTEANDSPLQSTAATVLLEIRERRALPAFRKVLELQLRKGNQSPGVGQIILFALGDMKDMESRDLVLKALTKGSPAAQREAAATLGKLKVKEAVPGLLKVVQKGRLYSRAGALIALGRIGDKRAARGITKSLTDRDAPVRWAALVALERLGDSTTISLLKPLLKDPHPFVAAQAKAATASLGGKRVSRVRAKEERDVQLKRLRALEREYLLRYQLSKSGPYFEIAAQKAAEEPVKTRMVYPNESAVLRWESVISTCGGSHPPIEFRIPVEVEAGADLGQPRFETNPAWVRWRSGLDAPPSEGATSNATFLAEESARAQRIYRVKTLRAQVENELAELDSAQAGSKRRP